MVNDIFLDFQTFNKYYCKCFSFTLQLIVACNENHDGMNPLGTKRQYI